MINISHPSAFIEREWQFIIGDTAAEAEKSGMLHSRQLELIYHQKWFKALMPGCYGGLELSIPQVVRLQEGLSWADGSFGWVFTLCCGAGWFAGFIDKTIASELFNDPHVCLAGSGAATGVARIADDGYLINGQWNYATGSHHATHFTANCVIKKGDEIAKKKDGSALILPFLIDKKDVVLLPTWKCIGMIATGSNSFKIENLHVGKERCFKIDPACTTIEGRLYKYPFLQLAEATLAANIMGMAIHFIDLAEDIIGQGNARNKYPEAKKTFLADKLKSIKTRFNTSRQTFYDAVDASWEESNKQNLQEVSINSRRSARIARKYIDDLYPYCGLRAASPETEINRIWRDLHTASQHTLLL
jgi:alkylation response protein AidB-like acyl-CoA dehydrogenase